MMRKENAHDLNNLLTIILMNAQILLDDTPAGETQKAKKLHTIVSTTERAALLVKEITRK